MPCVTIQFYKGYPLDLEWGGWGRRVVLIDKEDGSGSVGGGHVKLPHISALIIFSLVITNVLKTAMEREIVVFFQFALLLSSFLCKLKKR